MRQYIDLVKTVLREGTLKQNRTGVDTLSYFCYPFRHDLKDGFPLLTTKKMNTSRWNSLVYELLWFLKGEHNIRDLRKHTKIWNAWADENGNLESAYGWYWRNFPHTGGKMNLFSLPKENSTKLSYRCGNFDQLSYCIHELKNNPNSRRMVVSAWEPYNAHKSKLPPCHLLYIFNVQNGRLCLSLTQRSCDLFLGVPYNIASYALLIHIIAKETGLEPGILSIMFVDAHIYCADKNDTTLVNDIPRCEYDHLSVIKQQIEKKPYPLPKIKISGGPWDNHKFEDFQLIEYKSHEPLRARVAI